MGTMRAARWRVVFAWTLLAAFAVACSAQQTRVRSVAGLEECEVYQAFARTIPQGQTAYIRPATIRFEYRIKNPDDTGSPLAPRKFQTWNPKRSSHQPGQDFELVTTDFFQPLVAEEATDIEQCLRDQAGVRIYDGSYSWFATTSTISAWLRFRGAEPPPLLNFSKVGISPDHRHALVYYEQECAGWCGIGELLLFERRDNLWVPLGQQVTWIS